MLLLPLVGLRHVCGLELEETLLFPLFPRSPEELSDAEALGSYPSFLWSWDGLSAVLGWLVVAFGLSWPPLPCPAPSPSSPQEAVQFVVPLMLQNESCCAWYPIICVSYLFCIPFCYFVCLCLRCAFSVFILQGRSSWWPEEASPGHGRVKLQRSWADTSP